VVIDGLIRGWQVTADLVYAMFALLTVLISRYVEGRAQEGRLVTPLLFVLLVCNVLLLYRCGTDGPFNVFTVPPRLFGQRYTLAKICKWFVFGSNLLLMLAIAIDYSLS
jgi:hypothetical protein